ncbi:hypothetical protein Tco_1004266 [Tanacetum coccineum]|uniref:MAK10-like protein n=1 Tax=Tanacetum coccineum TaxID=301880 RepID=A0ABQ5FC42_9ASTR
MGDANPIRTLGDYSKPSYESYRNTIELPEGNNVVPLRSDTIRLVQNGCSFHGLRSEGPNQHLKDFLKLVDSLNLDCANRERTRLRFFNFPFAIKIAIFLNVFQHDPSLHGRTYSKNSYIIASTFGSMSKSFMTMSLLPQDEPLTNQPMDFAKPVKAISLPQDVPSTFDRRLIELEHQVQRLMEAYIALMQPTQVNKITSSCEIDELKDLHLNLSVLKVLAHAPMYNAILDKYVESLELGKNGSAFIQGEMPKKIEDPGLFTLPLGEGITRSVFGVKGIELGQEEAPYWTTLGKRESYKPRPSSDGVGARTPYYARKDFLDCHLPGE